MLNLKVTCETDRNSSGIYQNLHDRRRRKTMFGFGMKKLVAFAGGVLFGTAGMKILASRDAKKVYTEATAAAPHTIILDISD